MRTNPTCAWAVVVGGAFLCHCSSNNGGPPSKDGGTADAPDDAAQVATEAGAPLPFQSSNVTFAQIATQAVWAQEESVTASCDVGTALSGPDDDCFGSPLMAVPQADGSTVNLVVVESLTVAAGAVVRVTGPVPLVIVSLSDVSLSGAIDAHSASLNLGAGGAPAADSNMLGMGMGGGSAGSATAAIGGSGGSFCGLGGYGGGSTAAATPAMTYGNSDIRPLVGGSAGGGGTVGSGAGGGAIQIVAGGTLNLAAGSWINAGGEGGPIGGLAADQNAGGGGSGGAILLEATTVVVAGTLAANGGGGGGDYGAPSGADATADATPAAGGAAGTSVAAGGNGSAGSTPSGAAGVAGTMGLNSGGGGGGSGRIRINTSNGAVAITGLLSPSQMTACSTTDTVRAAGTAP
jgi:hypothetical protein